MDSLDQSVITRLVNIKGTYEHATLLLENPTPLDGAIALLLMDNALEAIFKLILDKSMKEKVGRDVKFPELLDKACQELKELRKYKLSLLALHNARNGFQHHGTIPDLSTILGEYKPLTENILRLISERRFGLKWEDISLSLLIRDERIKGLYRRAEESFVKGDYVAAAAYLIYIFEVVKTIARISIFGSGLYKYRSRFEKQYSRKGSLSDLISYVTTLDEEIEVFKLGLNYFDVRNYLDVAQFVGISSILYDIPRDKKEEEIIREFKEKLKKNITDDSLLKEWYMSIRDSILKFIIKTERRWRFSLRLLELAIKSLIEGISEELEKISTSLFKALRKR